MPAPATRHPCLWHGTPVLLLLLPALATALGCANLRTQQSTFNWHSLQLLKDMAPSSPPSCAQHDEPLPFPDTLLAIHDPQQATAAILRTLNHLFTTLSEENTPAHWHNRTKLLNQLQHQIQHLQQCLTAGSRHFKSQGPRNLNITRYFHHIQKFLRTHNHSPCAWENVRLIAQTCFQHIHKLTRRMAGHSAPSLQTHPPPNTVPNGDTPRLQPPQNSAQPTTTSLREGCEQLHPHPYMPPQPSKPPGLSH
ncbi:interferon-like [Dromaius novaehollandiae]|uniref:interferon-like n=1 Tax=Dromaius novaehollandiae TaxID=8790 RepID=UPI00312045AD